MAGERNTEFEFLLQGYSIGDLSVYGVVLVISFDTLTKKSLKTFGIFDEFDIKLPFYL